VLAASAVTAAPTQGAHGTLTVSGGNPVRPGRIVAIGRGPATPNGLIARVTAVHTRGATSTLRVAPASLAELVESGTVNLDTPAASVSSAVRRADQARLARAAESDLVCSGSADAKVTASLTLGASLKGQVSFGFFSVKSASLIGEAHVNASLAAELAVSGSCSIKDRKLVTLKGPTFTFFVGEVPVVVTTEVPVVLNAQATVQAQETTNVSGGFSAQAGIAYQSGHGFSPVADFTPKFTYQPPTVTASGAVSASLTSTLVITVDGLAHADLALTAGLAFDSDSTATPLWTLTAPVSLTGKVELSVFGLATISSPTLTLYHHTFTLATAQSPPPPPPPPTWTLGILAGNGQSGTPTPGPALQTSLGSPTDVAVDSAGNVYISDDPNEVIEKVTPQGVLSIVAGQVGQSGTPTPGPATSSALDLNAGGSCGGVAVDTGGDVYIADCGNDVIEKVTPDGTLSIVAGQAGNSGSPTPGPADQSQLDDPAGVAIDHAGNLYIADDGNNVVEKVTPDGTLSIAAGEVDQDGTPTPGPATATTIGSGDVAVDPGGTIFYADGENNLVEEITPGGQLSIVAGVPGGGGTPVAGPATQSPLDFGGCGQVAVTASDELLIADCNNDAVESVSPAGTLAVVAGTPGESGSPTPGPAGNSFLNAPTGVAVDSAGNAYVADSNNAVVEKLIPPS
jgi:hypothetical protein